MQSLSLGLSNIQYIILSGHYSYYTCRGTLPVLSCDHDCPYILFPDLLSYDFKGIEWFLSVEFYPLQTCSKDIMKVGIPILTLPECAVAENYQQQALGSTHKVCVYM